MLWNRQEVIDALPEYNVEIGDNPGGDWDLIPLYVKHPERMGDEDDCIHITPFISPESPGVIDPFENQEVVAIEVRNQHGDSAGGCETDDEAIERMYSNVKIRLRKMGHRIISHYDQIF